jgi:hypothetical protein
MRFIEAASFDMDAAKLDPLEVASSQRVAVWHGGFVEALSAIDAISRLLRP